MDFWPLDRWRLPGWMLTPTPAAGQPAPRFPRQGLDLLVVEKIPMLAIAGCVSMEAMYSQNAGGALNSLVGLPLGSRVANALVSYVAYLGQTFWPTNLAIFYPHPGMIYTDHINPSWTLTFDGRPMGRDLRMEA